MNKIVKLINSYRDVMKTTGYLDTLLREAANTIETIENNDSYELLNIRNLVQSDIPDGFTLSGAIDLFRQKSKMLDKVMKATGETYWLDIDKRLVSENKEDWHDPDTCPCCSFPWDACTFDKSHGDTYYCGGCGHLLCGEQVIGFTGGKHVDALCPKCNVPTKRIGVSPLANALPEVIPGEEKEPCRSFLNESSGFSCTLTKGHDGPHRGWQSLWYDPPSTAKVLGWLGSDGYRTVVDKDEHVRDMKRKAAKDNPGVYGATQDTNKQEKCKACNGQHGKLIDPAANDEPYPRRYKCSKCGPKK